MPDAQVRHCWQDAGEPFTEGSSQCILCGLIRYPKRTITGFVTKYFNPQTEVLGYKAGDCTRSIGSTDTDIKEQPKTDCE